MASICTEQNGRRRIVFHDAEGIRRTIRLGKTSKRGAEQTKLRIEHLVAEKIENRAVDDETSRWLKNVGAVLRQKLAKVGLIEEMKARTLGPFVDDYIASRSDVKKGTSANYRHTRRNLVDHFGADMPLRNITAGDAIDFRKALLASGLEESTTRKRCGIASQIFLYARKHKIVEENPFDSVPKNVRDLSDGLTFLKLLPKKCSSSCPTLNGNFCSCCHVGVAYA